MRIFLTGATGFLGSRVAYLLAEAGHTLTALVRPSGDRAAISPYDSQFIVGDVTDPVLLSKAVEGHEAIVHLAADLSHWRRHRDRIFRTNVIGTRVVAEAAETAGVAILIHVSSVAAVGYAETSTPIAETAPNNFIPLRLVYHESKRLAEDEAREAIDHGVRVVIVNPGTLYGPRELSHPFGHTMLELAAHKIPGHPTGGLSVTDVDDAASGILLALTKGRGGERYLLAGHNLTYEQIFRRQAETVGVVYNGRPLPAALMQIAARAFEFGSRFTGKEPRMTIDNAKIAPLRMWYDSAKAERELGYSFRPLNETFERMARHYRDAGLL